MATEKEAWRRLLRSRYAVLAIVFAVVMGVLFLLSSFPPITVALFAPPLGCWLALILWNRQRVARISEEPAERGVALSLRLALGVWSVIAYGAWLALSR
jgi:hypothetical protein